jgi:hypothetical protein
MNLVGNKRGWTMGSRIIKFECISSKNNLAHDIARDVFEEKEALEISIPLYDLSQTAYIAYQHEQKIRVVQNL